MKKIAMTMVALLTMTAAVAQNNENGERREFKKPTPEEMTNRMADQLKLDDKQKTKVLELNKEYEGVLAREWAEAWAEVPAVLVPTARQVPHRTTTSSVPCVLK